MGSAWAGDWEGRIDTFITQKGYESVWDFLTKNPYSSFIEIAEMIGDAAAIQIERIVCRYCLDHKLLSELICDTFVRDIHATVPNGFGGRPFDPKRSMMFSGGGMFPSPYSEARRLMIELLSRENPPEIGWIPMSRDDGFLRATYDTAVSRLSSAERKLIAEGGYIRSPGEIYWSAIRGIWKTISIYDGSAEFLLGFGAVDRWRGHLYAVHWCQSEVNNGGFKQFFQNSTGVLAPEAAEGFSAIGLPACAALVSEGMSYFGQLYPRDRRPRIGTLPPTGANSCVKDDPFANLDARFFNEMKDQKFAKSADEYAAKMIG